MDLSTNLPKFERAQQEQDKEAYFKRPELSNSVLGQLERSLEYYFYCISNKTTAKVKHFELGSIIDDAICLGNINFVKVLSAKIPSDTMLTFIEAWFKHGDKEEAFNETTPYKTFSETMTRFNKDEVQNYVIEQIKIREDVNSTFVDIKTYEQIQQMFNNITKNIFYQDVIKNKETKYQEIVTWNQLTNNGTEVKMRGMLDAVLVQDDIVKIIDFKTTADNGNLKYVISKWDYARQLAGYREALRQQYPNMPVEVYMFFIRTSAPYEVEVLKLNDTQLNYGLENIVNTLSKYQQYFTEGYLDYTKYMFNKPAYVEIL